MRGVGKRRQYTTLVPWVLVVAYGLFALVAGTNWALMRRPFSGRRSASGVTEEVGRGDSWTGERDGGLAPEPPHPNDLPPGGEGIGTAAHGGDGTGGPQRDGEGGGSGAPAGEAGVVFLIPARNEAENLERLIPALLNQGVAKWAAVFVYDDESTDGTGEVASRLGACVVFPAEPLRAGWTGKNRACHELAMAAIAQSDAGWLVFLDADAHPSPEFEAGIRELIWTVGDRCPVITGFPTIVPGRWPQSLFLAWVGWILLATDPFGVVSATKLGHNRFTNGQFSAWRRDTYARLRPNEAVRGAILEDVKIGRLCATQGVPIEVANVSRILSVKMYDTWRETLDGMSKNSHEVAGSALGTSILAALLLLIGWGWALAGPLWPWALGLLLASGACCAAIVRAGIFGTPLLPVSLTIGSFTLFRSMVWHQRGKVVWKGRTYPR